MRDPCLLYTSSEELLGCLENPRTPLEGTCVRNEGACESDADCTSGGCGGELCFNPALSEGVTTCECTAPAGGCGCINGQCAWYE